MKKSFCLMFLVACVLVFSTAFAQEEAGVTSADRDDFFFLLRLAQTIGHERVSENLFSILKRSQRSPSYPVDFRRLTPADRAFLESLAESVSDPIVSDRLLHIAEKIPKASF